MNDQKKNDKFDNNKKIQTIVYFWRFFWMKILKMYCVNFKLYVRISDEIVDFVDFFVIIFCHERIIWNILKKILNVDQKREHIF